MGNKSRIYFLVKDPHWTFIWWEIGADQSAGQLVLRIHDVTHIIFNGDNSHRFIDVAVTGQTDHWYLYIPTSNRNYCAEIGSRSAGGVFHPLARSNTIYLPRDCPSDVSANSASIVTIP